jgi:hypothetical protein
VARRNYQLEIIASQVPSPKTKIKNVENSVSEFDETCSVSKKSTSGEALMKESDPVREE